MAGTLGGLLVTLGLDSTQFTEGLNRSEQQMQQTSAAAVALGVAVGEKLGDAVVDAAKKLWEFAQGAIEAAAHLKDLEKQTGITVESLAGLERVGKLSSTGLDEIAGASNRLNRSLLTNGEGSTATARAIKALGLDFTTFKNLKPDEQMLSVAEAMGKFQDGTGKGAAAMALFGRSGAPFLKFLAELAERGIMVTAQTTEMAEASKKYEDSITILGFRTADLKTRLGADLVPVMNTVVEKLLELQSQTKEWTEVINPLTVILQTVAVLGANVAFVLVSVGRELGALAAQAAAVGRFLNDPTNLTGNLKENFKNFKLEWTGISDAVKADGVRARAELDKFEEVVMKPRQGGYKDPRILGSTGTIAQQANALLPVLTIPDKDKKGGGGDRVAEAQRYLDSLQKQLETQEHLTATEKADIEITQLRAKAKSGLTAAIEEQIRKTAAEIDTIKTWQEYGKQQEEQRKKLTAQMIEQGKAHNDVIEGMLRELDTMVKFNKDLEVDILLMGSTTAAKADLEAATIASAIAIKQEHAAILAKTGADEDELSILLKEIDALEKRRQLIFQKAEKQDLIDTKELADKTTSTMSDSIAAGILDGFQRGNTLADVFLNTLKAQFAKTVLSPILQPIVKAGNDLINGLLQGIVRGIGGLNATSGYGIGGGGADLGAAGLVGAGRSGGGPVGANSLVRVNEKRTEGLNLNGEQFLLMGNQGGSIDSNPNMGGQGPNIYQNLNVGQGVSRNELAQAMVIAKESAKAEILRSMRTNGAFTRASG